MSADKENSRREIGFWDLPSDPDRISPSPVWSIESVKSLDISFNTPRIHLPMDTEDSPWGGMRCPCQKMHSNAHASDCSRRAFKVELPSSQASDTYRRLRYYSRLYLGKDLIQFVDSSKIKSQTLDLPSTSSGPRSPSNKGPRTPRTPRRVEAQTTKLEAVDDSFDPLGPLGDSAPSQSEPPPAPPLKEQSLPLRNAKPGNTSMSSSMMDSVDLGDDADLAGSRARHPPPVQPPPTGFENIRRQTQPSVSIEQAAKPSFDITVGDPHKVGDLTSSHIVYQVRTKASSSIRSRCYSC